MFPGRPLKIWDLRHAFVCGALSALLAVGLVLAAGSIGAPGYRGADVYVWFVLVDWILPLVSAGVILWLFRGVIARIPEGLEGLWVIVSGSIMFWVLLLVRLALRMEDLDVQDALVYPVEINVFLLFLGKMIPLLPFPGSSRGRVHLPASGALLSMILFFPAVQYFWRIHALVPAVAGSVLAVGLAGAGGVFLFRTGGLTAGNE